MKTLKNKRYPIAVIIGLILVASLYAKDEEYTKNYKQEYNVNTHTQLILDNKYGNIDVNNWNENKILIEIHLKVKASSEERAKKIFEQINISVSENLDIITAKTEFENDFGDIFNNAGNNLLEIRYTVNMPSTVPLNLTNKYGNVFINEIKSTSTIDIKYGSLKANRIIHNEKQPFTQVILGYSNATIQTCTWVKFDVKYSNLEITDSKALIMVSKYSKITVSKGTSIVSESKYDTYRFGKISNIVANAGYSNFKADEVSRKIQMETKYTDMSVTHVPINFESIKINIGYGNYKILIDPSASYKIDGYAKYAKISYPENSKVNRFNENNEIKVTGLVGNNTSTKSEITISSSYADVKLAE